MVRSINSLFLSLALCTASFAMVDDDNIDDIVAFQETSDDNLINLEEEEEQPQPLDLTIYQAEETAEKVGCFSCLRMCLPVPKNSLASMSASVTFGNFSKVRKKLKKNKNKKWDLLPYAQTAFNNGYTEMGQFILDFRKFNRERNELKKQLEKKEKGKLKGSKLIECENNRKEQNNRLNKIEWQILKINYKKILEAYNAKQIIKNDFLPWEIFEILAQEIKINENLKGTVLYYLVNKYREHQFDDELKHYWTRNLWTCLKDNILLENMDSLMSTQNSILGDHDDPNLSDLSDLDVEKRSLLDSFINKDDAKKSKEEDFEIDLEDLRKNRVQIAVRAIQKGLTEVVIPFQDNYLLSIFDPNKIWHFVALRLLNLVRS